MKSVLIHFITDYYWTSRVPHVHCLYAFVADQEEIESNLNNVLVINNEIPIDLVSYPKKK